MTAVCDDSSVYYGATYWNDIPYVFRELNRRVSGNPDRTWVDRFTDDTGGRRFRCALSLNCGDGHVERGLIAAGIVESAVGIDYSTDLLDRARAEAEEVSANVRYHQMDVNTAAFPEGDYDLIVNHSAGHHIQRLDRVFRALCELLSDDGVLVAYDYVGPHRNQYPWPVWEAAHNANAVLPGELQQILRYPHLPTMLATDPTEAIHSELVVETCERYFSINSFVPLGGAIGYLVLTHNRRFLAAPPNDQEAWAAVVMDADAEFLAENPDGTLFSYWCATPDKATLADAGRLSQWALEEEEREQQAAANGGEYYRHTALQELMLELEDQRNATLHSRVCAEGLLAELADVRTRLARREQSFPVPQWERLRTSPPAQVIRRNPRFAGIARRMLTAIGWRPPT